MDEEKQATSIKINPVLWKKAKTTALNYDITVSELVEQAIQQWIETKNKHL